MRLSGGPLDPLGKPARLDLFPTKANRIVGFIGFVAIFLVGFGIAAGMYLQRGGAGSLLFVAIAISGMFLITPAFAGRLWADEREVGVSSALQRSRCPREQLSAMRIEPTMSKYGPACWFVRNDGSVAFKAQVNLWGLTQIASMARFLGLPLLNTVDRTGNTCPVCGYARLNEPVLLRGVASHEVCPSCGFAFDDPMQLNDQAYRAWRDQWINGGMTWWAQHAGQPPPIDWDPKTQLDTVTR